LQNGGIEQRNKLKGAFVIHRMHGTK
jgi:hypothetical protein